VPEQKQGTMKERPILFSTPMVQAILGGRKTMTRRIVKFPKDFTGEAVYDNNPHGLKYTSNMGGETIQRLMCPKGEVGDRLWVRETWTKVSVPDGTTARKLLTLYKASMPAHGIDSYQVKWKPSIYMPRTASRITIEITGIKVERLQVISEEDAIREGVEKTEFGYKNYDKSYPVAEFMGGGFPATRSFMTLWESINGHGSWNSDPFVWAIEFKRI